MVEQETGKPHRDVTQDFLEEQLDLIDSVKVREDTKSNPPAVQGPALENIQEPKFVLEDV